jgi:hypothetical protein
MKRIFYRVTSPGFADKEFSNQHAGITEIRSYKLGLPENKVMSRKNRNYWREVGKTMKLFRVVEVSNEVKL